MRRATRIGLPVIVGVWTLLYATGGSAALSMGRLLDRPFSQSPVEIQCARTADSVLRVTLSNHSGRATVVDLLGLAFAGHGGFRNRRGVFTRTEIWDHWWTQHGIRLASHGSWSAFFYVHRIEKFEARDPFGRLLASFDVRGLPDHHWSMFTAVNGRADWQPFGQAELFGQRLTQFRPGGGLTWHTITPSELPRCAADFDFVRPAVIGEVRAEGFTREQLDGLRGRVERGRTLIVCGGAYLGRLPGWERAGLLAAPVRGTRVVSGLRSLAQRYGVAPLVDPIPVADVGVVAPPARVALEEGSIPLVVERPLGGGILIFVTFDPTRPPFRGSRLERAFWQEWLGREGDDFWDVGVAPETGDAYRQAQRKLHLLPPSMGAIMGIWLGYLLALVLVLAVARRRVRALVALSACGSVIALALGPLLRGVHPAAACAGRLNLASGEDEGWWWGHADLMMPASGVVTLQAPNGFMDTYWEAPRIMTSITRRPDSSDVIVQPILRRWVPKGTGLDGSGRLPGSIDFDAELEGHGLYARVRNRTPQPLRDLAVVWGRTLSLRLGDLPPGRERRRLLATIGRDGAWTGPKESVPRSYAPVPLYWGRIDPLLLHPPALLARGQVAPPRLLANGRPINMTSETALVVMPSGFRVRGAFHLPREAVAARVVRAQGLGGTWGRREWWGTLTLKPRAWAAFELRLPAGAGRARWRSLELLLDRDVTLSARLSVFDWARQQWVPVAAFKGRAWSPPQPPKRFFRQWVPPPSQWSFNRQSVALPSPERFVNPYTDTILVRIENRGDLDGGVGQVEARGDGEAR